MKKIICLLAIVLVCVGFAGCALKQDASKAMGAKQETATTNTTQSKEQEEIPIVNVDQIELGMCTFDPPDSADSAYMHVPYKNNSKFPIKEMQITVLLKDQNKKVYLDCDTTVLPGETSPDMRTFGPKTQKADDVELLEYSIVAVDSNKNEQKISYDCKLNEYEVK